PCPLPAIHKRSFQPECLYLPLDCARSKSDSKFTKARAPAYSLRAGDIPEAAYIGSLCHL
ncbi:MAG: hypothetical protein PVH35_11755, partial [Syntrophobacterales bacterium]